MKDVQATKLPDCDLCGSAGCGAFNTPTRTSDPETGGRWANMCGPCFNKHGIDTSVTERRVLTGPTPDEVTAIAKRWGDSNSEPRYETEGVWRFTGDGFIYLVFSPGTDVPTYEDSGRPCGDAVFPTAWTVRAVNDAPDSFWTIEQDGTYVDPQGREVKVW